MCHCPQLSHGASHGAEAQTQIPEKPRSGSVRRRVKGMPVAPNWGWQVLHPATLTPGEGPQAPTRLPQAGCPHPSPTRWEWFFSHLGPRGPIRKLAFLLVR